MLDKLGITPGPWFVEESEKWPFGIDIVNPDGSRCILSSCRFAYSTSDNGLEDVYAGKAFDIECRDSVIKKNAEQKANHVLIAAAPEMLEALIEIEYEADCYGQVLSNRNIQIIEKATGRKWAEVKELIC